METLVLRPGARSPALAGSGESCGGFHAQCPESGQHRGRTKHQNTGQRRERDDGAKADGNKPRHRRRPFPLQRSRLSVAASRGGSGTRYRLDPLPHEGRSSLAYDKSSAPVSSCTYTFRCTYSCRVDPLGRHLCRWSSCRYETVEPGPVEVRLWLSHRGARCQLAVRVVSKRRERRLSTHRRDEEVAADRERDLTAATARLDHDGHGVARFLPGQSDEADEPGVRVAAAVSAVPVLPPIV